MDAIDLRLVEPERPLAGVVLVVGLGGRGNIEPRFRFSRGIRKRLPVGIEPPFSLGEKAWW